MTLKTGDVVTYQVRRDLVPCLILEWDGDPDNLATLMDGTGGLHHVFTDSLIAPGDTLHVWDYSGPTPRRKNTGYMPIHPSDVFAIQRELLKLAHTPGIREAIKLSRATQAERRFVWREGRQIEVPVNRGWGHILPGKVEPGHERGYASRGSLPLVTVVGHTGTPNNQVMNYIVGHPHLERGLHWLRYAYPDYYLVFHEHFEKEMALADIATLFDPARSENAVKQLVKKAKRKLATRLLMEEDRNAA